MLSFKKKSAQSLPFYHDDNDWIVLTFGHGYKLGLQQEGLGCSEHSNTLGSEDTSRWKNWEVSLEKARELEDYGPGKMGIWEVWQQRGIQDWHHSEVKGVRHLANGKLSRNDLD